MYPIFLFLYEQITVQPVQLILSLGPFLFSSNFIPCFTDSQSSDETPELPDGEGDMEQTQDQDIAPTVAPEPLPLVESMSNQIPLQRVFDRYYQTLRRC